MRKQSLLFIIFILLLISGCTKTVPKKKKPPCIIHPTSKDKKESLLSSDINISLSNEDKELVVLDEGAGGSNDPKAYCIIDVFTDSMFLNGDRFKLIKNLDASPKEKKILTKAYKNHTDLWNRKQREYFSKILEDDKYLSICDAQRYYDNLLFTTEEPQQDILYSILLLKYLDNLKNGCSKWVSTKIEKHRSSNNIHSLYLLDMIEKDAIVERLFIPYIPRKKSFLISIREYKRLVEKSDNKAEIKLKRLEIEDAKTSNEYPNYKK